MANLNKVMLIGRLGRDPEVRYTKTGNPVANFSLATTEFWKDRNGNKQERTEWHNVVCWDKLADLAQNYLKKGRLVYIEGALQTRDWVDTANVKHYRTEIRANILQFLERGDAAGQGASGGQGYQRPAQPAQPAQGGQGGYQQGGGAQGGGYAQGGSQQPAPPDDSYFQDGPPPGGYVEDDIPF